MENEGFGSHTAEEVEQLQRALGLMGEAKPGDLQLEHFEILNIEEEGYWRSVFRDDWTVERGIVLGNMNFESNPFIVQSGKIYLYEPVVKQLRKQIEKIYAKHNRLLYRPENWKMDW